MNPELKKKKGRGRREVVLLFLIRGFSAEEKKGRGEGEGGFLKLIKLLGELLGKYWVQIAFPGTSQQDAIKLLNGM
jgi:hypothetical protein